jgi:hypothetical protein
MVYWLRESPVEAGEAERERDRVQFTYERAPDGGASATS